MSRLSGKLAARPLSLKMVKRLQASQKFTIWPLLFRLLIHFASFQPLAEGTKIMGSVCHSSFLAKIGPPGSTLHLWVARNACLMREGQLCSSRSYKRASSSCQASSWQRVMQYGVSTWTFGPECLNVRVFSWVYLFVYALFTRRLRPLRLWYTLLLTSSSLIKNMTGAYSNTSPCGRKPQGLAKEVRH